MSISPPLNSTYMLKAANTTNPTTIFHMVDTPITRSNKNALVLWGNKGAGLQEVSTWGAQHFNQSPA